MWGTVYGRYYCKTVLLTVKTKYTDTILLLYKYKNISYPIADVSSSVVPRASNMRSSFLLLSPVNVADVPETPAHALCTCQYFAHPGGHTRGFRQKTIPDRREQTYGIDAPSRLKGGDLDKNGCL